MNGSISTKGGWFHTFLPMYADGVAQVLKRPFRTGGLDIEKKDVSIQHIHVSCSLCFWKHRFRHMYQRQRVAQDLNVCTAGDALTYAHLHVWWALRPCGPLGSNNF